MISSTASVSAATGAQAKSTIQSYLGTLVAADEAKITSLISDWDNISLNSGQIDAGGVTDVQGLSFSWDAKRKLIRERMQIYVPFFRYHEVLARENKSGGMFIPVVR